MEYERVRRDYIILPAPACQTLSIPFPVLIKLFRDPRNHLCGGVRWRLTVRVRVFVMGDDGAKAAATGIKQIVRLRELLHKWHLMALGAKQQRDHQEDDEDHAGGGVPDQDAVASAIPPFVLRRLRRAETADSVLSDDESYSPEPPPDVPRGYCPVYVGPEQRRFVIPTSYLAHPVFRLLLEKAEEEFGFRHQGALAIPCETEAFKYILQCVERHDKGLAAAAAAGDGTFTRG